MLFAIIYIINNYLKNKINTDTNNPLKIHHNQC